MDETAALLEEEGDRMNVLLRIDRFLECGSACESKPVGDGGGVCFAWGPKVRQWSECVPYFSGLRAEKLKIEEMLFVKAIVLPGDKYQQHVKP